MSIDSRRSSIELNSSINIFARIRGNFPWESDEVSSVCSNNDTVIHQSKHGRPKDAYKFTQVFNATHTNEDVFDDVCAPLLDTVVEGYNSILVAYGQTGSGKTYTVTGTRGMDADDLTIDHVDGLLSMSLKRLLEYEEVTNVELSAVETYGINKNKVKFYDLCSEDNIQDQWKEKDGSTKLERDKLESIMIQSNLDIDLNVAKIAHATHTAPTYRNPQSSRGHVIYIIKAFLSLAPDSLQREELASHVSRRYSENSLPELEKSMSLGVSVSHASFIIVDLAGSEGISAVESSAIIPMFGAEGGLSDAEISERKLEAAVINNGLIKLKMMFRQLKSGRIEQSQEGGLRKLLHPYLKSNDLISVMFNIAPSVDNLRATTNTLRFARESSLVKCSPVKNETALIVDKDELIRELQHFNDYLDEMLKEKDKIIDHLRTQLVDREFEATPVRLPGESEVATEIKKPIKRRRQSLVSDILGDDVDLFGTSLAAELELSSQTSAARLRKKYQPKRSKTMMDGQLRQKLLAFDASVMNRKGFESASLFVEQDRRTSVPTIRERETIAPNIELFKRQFRNMMSKERRDSRIGLHTAADLQAMLSSTQESTELMFVDEEKEDDDYYDSEELSDISELDEAVEEEKEPELTPSHTPDSVVIHDDMDVYGEVESAFNNTSQSQVEEPYAGNGADTSMMSMQTNFDEKELTRQRDSMEDIPPIPEEDTTVHVCRPHLWFGLGIFAGCVATFLLSERGLQKRPTFKKIAAKFNS